MRDYTQAAKDLLYLGNAWDEAQVVTFYLFDGTDVRRWTSAGHDITYGAETWLAGVVGVKVGDAVEESGTNVSTIDLELAGTISLGGAPLAQAALAEAFGGVRVVVQTLFLDGPYPTGAVVGASTDFDGHVADVQPGTGVTKLQAKSPTARADGRKGFRIIGTTCSFVVYGSECGATIQESSATVAAGSTTRQVNLVSVPATAGIGSRILFTSGALNGLAMLIRSVGTGAVYTDQEMASAPSAGVTCVIRRGCDHTLAGCNALGNILRNGGAAKAPSRDLWTPEV